MPIQKLKASTIVRLLLEEGYEDVLVIDTRSAGLALTPRRREILERLQEERRESVSDLANVLDRDIAAVSRDLSHLSKYDLVKFEREEGEKIPIARHTHIVVADIVSSSESATHESESKSDQFRTAVSDHT